MRSHYDIVIVGARCAGASTAMLLARSGLRVLVVDRDAEGSDTLSTHALMRGGVQQLARWGVLDGVRAAGTPAIRTTTFHYACEAIEIPIKPLDGVDALYAPRRPVLDGLLVEAARAAGADVVHGTSAVDLVRDAGGRVRGLVLQRAGGGTTEVRAELVVGADGRRSRVARLAGAAVEQEGEFAAGVIYGYFEGLARDGFHWHYRPGVSVGVIPTNDGRTCVFVEMPDDRFRRQLALGLETLHRQVLAETSPALARDVAGATRVGRLRPYPGIRGFIRRSYGPGWALVGDAGYFRDPITAHGITDALRDAELLARAVLRGTEHALAGYQTARDRMARDMLATTDELASFAWDLERAKVLHLEASRQMKAEVELIRSWGAPPGTTTARGYGAICPTAVAIELHEPVRLATGTR